MKSKTIKQVLTKKFNEFVSSITDETVKRLVKANSIITGGSIASMLKGEEVNDYDVYFTNRETVLAVCNYYIQKFCEGRDIRHEFTVMEEPIEGFKSSYQYAEMKPEDYDKHMGTVKPDGRIKIRIRSVGVAAEPGFKFDEQEEDVNQLLGNEPEEEELPDYVKAMSKKDRKKWIKEQEEKKKYRPVYISANAITLSDKVQLIIRFYGDAETIHSNYDFAHCTCWWRSRDGHLELPSEALECLLTGELRYRGSKYPLASIIRSRKFINRGMHINAGQYLKMCMQLNDMNLRDLNVLEDQLIGVDALYFASMLANIPPDKKINNQIDSTYLIEMINRFF